MAPGGGLGIGDGASDVNRPIKIAVVSDIHYGPTLPSETKLGGQALELLDDVLEEMIAYGPDLFVELGDRLSDVGVVEDAARLEELAQRFGRLPCRREHLQGNHDIVHLSAESTAEILGATIGHRSVIVRDWHLVFWDADPRYGRGLRIADADLEWLERDLASNDLPAVVFSHVPLGGGSMIGNYYFEGRPEGRAGHLDAERARSVMEHSGRVVLALAGHVHWNSLNVIDGSYYVTIQSLSESFTTPPHAAAAWAALELARERITVRIHGRDPFEVILRPKPIGSHWIVPRARTRDASTSSATGAGTSIDNGAFGTDQ